MTLWMDLTNSLTKHKGNVAGIIRAELMLAKHMHEIDPSVGFSVLTRCGFRRVRDSELNWLFKSQNLNDDYREYQKRKKRVWNRLTRKIWDKLSWHVFRFQRRFFRSRSIPKKQYLKHPYQDGDTVFACGWYGTKKEEFFERIKYSMHDLKLVYTIYDMVMVKDNLRHLYYPGDVAFDRYMTWISSNCDAVIYGGHTAQVDAEEYFKDNNLCIPNAHWVKWGNDIKAQDSNIDTEQVLAKLGVRKPYILSVGSFDHKKNYKVLYDAYCQMGQRNVKNVPQLVIVGRKIAGVELQDAMVINPLTRGHIKILGCSDAELDVLYKNCEFSVLPTLYEGWSLTLPESLSYGKLCLCSDVAPLREVGGTCGYYIKPESACDWAEAIERFINNPSEIQAAEENIRKKFKSVSWSDCANDLYNFLTEIKDETANTNSDKPTLYYDLSMLEYTLSGIPRTEMLLARHLYRYNKNMKFFFMNRGTYCELSPKQLSHLLSDKSLDQAVAQDKQLSSYITSQTLPFKHGDVVFSASVGYNWHAFRKMMAHHKAVGFTCCNVIYDLTPITVPHTHPAERVAWYPKYLNDIYNLCDYIFYGGATAQSDGEKYQRDHGMPVGKSFVLKWGSDIVSKKHTKSEVNAVMKKYGIVGDFIISVGTIEARKNQEVLYEAYLELMRNAKKGEKLPQIVICGHPGWKTENFQRLINIDNRTRDKVMLITPTDDELDILYQNCKFTCLASFYEGWSLTLPESLNYGKFCLAADTPSLKEIGEDIIDYADPYNPIEWAEKIKFYFTNAKALKERENAIKKKWHNITWGDCARELNKTLQKFMEK